MIGAGDAAIGPGDLAAGHVSGDERLVDGSLDIARSGLDADAKMIRRSGNPVAERFAIGVRDERGCFRRASIDPQKVRHAAQFTRRTAICSPLQRRFQQ